MTTQAQTWTQTDKRHNEDASCVGPNWICVVDGATPLNSRAAENEATSRFAHKLVQVVHEMGLTPGDIALEISQALQVVQDTIGAQGATATISAVAWDAEIVCTASLGDSIILIEREESDTTIIRDPHFAGREDLLLQPVVHAMKRGIPPKDAYAEAAASLRTERRRRNTAEGVWVLSDSAPAEQMLGRFSLEAFPRQSVARVAAMTDGMWRAVDLFNLLRPDELLTRAETGKIHEVFACLRKAEERDPDRIFYPRFSLKDDATLAFASLI